MHLRRMRVFVSRLPSTARLFLEGGSAASLEAFLLSERWNGIHDVGWRRGAVKTRQAATPKWPAVSNAGGDCTNERRSRSRTTTLCSQWGIPYPRYTAVQYVLLLRMPPPPLSHPVVSHPQKRDLGDFVHASTSPTWTSSKSSASLVGREKGEIKIVGAGPGHRHTRTRVADA
jgi:hypothetical protein